MKMKRLRVGITGHWGSTCYDVWIEYAHMSENGQGGWNFFHLVHEPPYDMMVVINAISPLQESETKNIAENQIIVFHQEPYIPEHPQSWGKWSNMRSPPLYYLASHSNTFNNIQWHLSKNYQWLCKNPIVKDNTVSGTLSTILSSKYNDPGHKKRVDFIKYIENNVSVHVFGSNAFHYKHYCGPLPHREKDNGLFPYKYTFNAENHAIPNYMTEKIVDAILSECLCFYWGCPNLHEWLDENAYVRLNLDNKEESLQIIHRAINENWYEQRLPIIRKEKQKILHYYQFFPRLERILLHV